MPPCPPPTLQACRSGPQRPLQPPTPRCFAAAAPGPLPPAHSSCDMCLLAHWLPRPKPLPKQSGGPMRPWPQACHVAGSPELPFGRTREPTGPLGVLKMHLQSPGPQPGRGGQGQVWQRHPLPPPQLVPVASSGKTVPRSVSVIMEPPVTRCRGPAPVPLASLETPVCRVSRKVP